MTLSEAFHLTKDEPWALPAFVVWTVVLLFVVPEILRSF